MQPPRTGRESRTIWTHRGALRLASPDPSSHCRSPVSSVRRRESPAQQVVQAELRRPALDVGEIDLGSLHFQNTQQVQPLAVGHLTAGTKPEELLRILSQTGDAMQGA